MVQRSLRASQEGIESAQKALIRMSLNQQTLAARLAVTRQPIGKFFRGEPVKTDLFVEICKTLKLDWEAISGNLDRLEITTEQSADCDALVQKTREHIRSQIEQQCGMMRVLDMSHPIELSAIYTDVNILQKLSGRQRLEITELIAKCSLEDFDRFSLSIVQEERVDGFEAVEQYDKLVVLGQPGAGKTTFLKRLAMQCINQKFQANRVPIFVTLKAFAEADGKPSLLDYLPQSFELSQKSSEVAAIAAKLRSILTEGKALILLDGLDEVKEGDSQRVVQQIERFATQFHRNQFVMTCRIAAREYTFKQFTEVEVADFDQEQIHDFVTKWFATKQDPVKAETFKQKLEENEQIRELATNPLLLTLLCLAFGEAGDFPTNRSELYEEGLDALLRKWDVSRNIERDRVYKKLSLQRKEDLLSQLAYAFFERGEYFFKQRVVVDKIIRFIRNAPNVSQDEHSLELDGAVVLRSIQAQHGLLIERAHGIYSFSHLTFQEYFTARQIKEKRSDELLQNLVSHITEKRWREVFLLTAEMLPDADHFVRLMKADIDQLLADEPDAQQLLQWVYEKSESVEASYKPVAIRAFYFALARARAPDRSLPLVRDFDLDHALALARTLDRALALDRDLDRALALDRTLALALALALALDRALALALARALAQDVELKRKLQELRDDLPDASLKNRENFKHWWQSNGQAWTERLRDIMIQHRNIGHNWQFSDAQKKRLQQYYDANHLLVKCLNSECYVSPEVRREIEDTLLLPLSELEKRREAHVRT